MGFWESIIEYDYLRNAFISCVLTGVICGLVGTYVVSRRIVFLSGGITHASFGGLGMALFFNTNPLIGALTFAIGSSLGIEWASQRGQIREDSAIGMLWSIGMAIGALFMALRPGYTSGELSSYLFGSIVTVTNSDVVLLSIFTLVILVATALWLRPIMYVAFDRQFASSQGINTKLVSYMMAAVIAITIVLCIRVMGIVLLISMLTMPVIIANSFSKSFSRIPFIAMIVGLVANVAGLYASFMYELPPGVTIISALTILLIATRIARK